MHHAVARVQQSGDPLLSKATELYLVVATGPDAGRRHALSRDRLVVGADPVADVVLSDPAAAGLHCEFRRAGREVRVIELLQGGTFVDGAAVADARLIIGQIVTVGATQLRLEVGPATSTQRRFRVLSGTAPATRSALLALQRSATSDVTLLLQGETGTGKESAAELVHRSSPRANGPLVVVDCGSIPSNLLESELFGHERGSFTGAVAARQGAFEVASGGTVFLDEIGELAGELQPKLLRVLERREVKRVGASHYQPVDVRVVAATSRDLVSEVRGGRFRKDLYYRLAVVQIRMPPLRERLEDLPILVEQILEDLGVGDRPDIEVLRSPLFQAELARHAWPGNIRELRNYIERCLTLGPMPLADPHHELIEELVDAIDTDVPLKIAREQIVRRFEERYLKAMLARHGGNVSAAARAAGIDRITLYRMLGRTGLR